MMSVVKGQVITVLLQKDCYKSINFHPSGTLSSEPPRHVSVIFELVLNKCLA